ncbi:MAG: MetQ/NlpA family ABC transporter substrate-binding protein [Candidatus Nanopelagicales bacterium]
MKKAKLTAVAALVTTLLLSACGGGSDAGTETVPDPSTPLKIGATPVPHAEILEHIKAKAQEEGLNIEIVEYSDYVQPNTALSEGKLDANYFQHLPYLEGQIAERGYKFTALQPGIHLEPLGVYSQKVKSLDELAEGATVSIPNDPTNAGRALKLLAANGLIELPADASTTVTVGDITSNPKNLKITEIEAATLPRTLADVDAAVINGNYALEADLDPSKDALVLESPTDNPYVNVVVVRTGTESDPRIVKLLALLTSDDVREFIESKYQGTVIPAF